MPFDGPWQSNSVTFTYTPESRVIGIDWVCVCVCVLIDTGHHYTRKIIYLIGDEARSEKKIKRRIGIGKWAIIKLIKVYIDHRLTKEVEMRVHKVLAFPTCHKWIEIVNELTELKLLMWPATEWITWNARRNALIQIAATNDRKWNLKFSGHTLDGTELKGSDAVSYTHLDVYKRQL